MKAGFSRFCLDFVQEGKNYNKLIFLSSNARGCLGRMFKLQFDRCIRRSHELLIPSWSERTYNS